MRKHTFSAKQKRSQVASLFCLPSEAGKPVGLKEARIALTEGKIIRIARALLANGRV
ncbi:hypothetical protein FORC54_0624 [Vibrio vulnificus]|nr:hypothetical protein FORC54_0624 [Vibrio vulnificus]